MINKEITMNSKCKLDWSHLSFIGLESGRVIILMCYNWYKPKFYYYEVLT